jgi:hypothetical protein
VESLLVSDYLNDLKYQGEGEANFKQSENVLKNPEKSSTVSYFEVKARSAACLHILARPGFHLGVCLVGGSSAIK